MAGFKSEDVQRLLVECHRCCSICHRFCGVKIEIDHIEQRADGGPDTYENAIPVCFECHADIHSYNPRHPRGRKFQPEELRDHRDRWVSICKEHPEIFRTGEVGRADVGPLQSLIDELDFNEAVCSVQPGQDQLCLFKESQFLEAIRAGSIAILEDELKRAINNAYVHIAQVNQLITSMIHASHPAIAGDLYGRIANKIQKAHDPVRTARQKLLAFLGNT